LDHARAGGGRAFVAHRSAERFVREFRVEVVGLVVLFDEELRHRCRGDPGDGLEAAGLASHCRRPVDLDACRSQRRGERGGCLRLG
jgi:hypothetical protein